MAIDGDAPFLRIAQTLQQGERRGLAGPRMPDERHRLARQGLEVRVLDADRAIGKTEGEILVAHVPARLFERARAWTVEDRTRRVHEIEIGVDRRLLLKEAEEEM